MSEQQQPPAQCADVATQFALCVDASSGAASCFAAGKSLLECAASAPECDALHRAYTACRRGQLDMRTRIRGQRFRVTTNTPSS